MRKLLAGSMALGLTLSFAGVGALPAAGQSAGPPDRAIDRELVVVHTTADGAITRTSLVDSLTVYGNGPVKITDLGETKGLRNLIGFEGPAISGPQTHVAAPSLTWNVNVKGSKELLTVAHPTRPLPVSVTPRYFLGDKQVKAEALLGVTGDIAIEYDLVNNTARTESLEITDQFGRKSTVPLQTYVPFLAQVGLELPADTWERIDASGGQVITDENKINHVVFTPVLAPIIGDVNQTVRIAGRVRDFELGEARIVFVPLVPPGVAERASETAVGTQKLFGGVGQIDANLQRLYQGTVALADGLSQLYDGILTARAGLGDVGTSDTIVDGLKLVLDGLKLLGDAEEGVPAISAGVGDLIDGIEEILAGIGSATTDDTILGGLSDIDDGLGALDAGLATIKGGIDLTSAGVGALATAGIGTAPAGAPATPTAATTISNDVQYLEFLATTAAALCGAPCSGLGITPAAIIAVSDGAVQAKLDAVRTCMTTGGVPGVCSAPEPNGVTEALTALSLGVGLPSDPPTTARGGVAAISAGITELIAGIDLIKAGLESGDVDNPGVLEGLELVADGVTEVIAGIGTVGDEDTLTDGVNQLFEGSKDLADGIDEIAAGAFDARGGAQIIGQGQYSLSQFGTQALQRGIGDNVEKASAALAVLNAMKSRAEKEAFLFGPPEGAAGSATYVFEIAGITDRNLATAVKFGVGGVLLLLLVGAGVAAVRRSE